MRKVSHAIDLKQKKWREAHKFYLQSSRSRWNWKSQWSQEPSMETTNEKNIARQVLTYNSKKIHWLNGKLDLQRTMNGLGKSFRKKSNPKIEKNSKIKMNLSHVNTKSLARKQIFCSNTVFSLYFKSERKNFTPHNNSRFRYIYSCFGVTKITTPIWLQKPWK